MVQVEERLAFAPQPEAEPAPHVPQQLVLRWYPLVFASLVLAGFLLRIHRLGERALHHDESLHALYSWYLYVGRGYVHDPMMHGPWQFHWTALIYFLFGDSDFTARLAPALFGTALIAAPYFLRHELGRAGAVVASVLLTISPAFLYFSRFAREDIYFAAWNALMVVGIFGLLRTRKERYVYLTAFGLAGGFATKEAIYITGFIWVTFFALLLTVFRRSKLAGEVWAAIAAVPRSAWPKAVGLVVAMDAVLFTTFFTNMGDPWNCLLGRRCTPGGLWTGTIGALVYWIEQHGVQRGGQPWFYYLMLVPLYEFVPLVLALASVVWRRAPRNLFFWFCLYWALLAFVIYSYAGEKMPWITPHIVLPILLLGAQGLGAWIERLDRRRLLLAPSLSVFGLGLLALALCGAAVGLSAVRALTPLERQSFALERLSFLLALAGIVAGVVWIRRRHREALVGAPLALAGLTALGAFYIHTSWQLSYAHGDIPVEMMVYVQSSPDVPLVVQEIERIAFQTGQGKDLRILLDNGYTETVGGQQIVHEAISWPFEWYLRDYKNRRYYSKTFGSDINLNDYPVVLVMAPNVDPVRDKLANYNAQKYRLNWWFPEDYKGLAAEPPAIAGVKLPIPWLKWGTIWQGLLDPENRARLLQYLLYREPLNPLGAREFYFFVRKDIPLLGPAPSTPRGQAAASGARHDGTAIQRPDGSTILGQAADGSSLLSDPKDVAIGPDGNLYITEGAAGRVTVLAPDGRVVASWGRLGGGAGEFQEPWGIAVSARGEVYVADTWNHRIEKFDLSGRFITEWGGLADTGGRVDVDQGRFWGPRDVAIGPDGLVYVTDTGNKRVQVFDADGRFVRAFGGEGSEPGRFREPVGLAFDGDTLLVADTWNGRVQRLDLEGRPLAQVSIAGWEGQSVTNKPYLTVGPEGEIVVSAPDRSQVLVYDRAGRLLQTFEPTEERTAPGLPTGLARGPDGAVYVADSGGNLVYRLPVLRSAGQR